MITLAAALGATAFATVLAIAIALVRVAAREDEDIERDELAHECAVTPQADTAAYVWGGGSDDSESD